MFKNFNIVINNMNNEKLLFSCLSLLLTFYIIRRRNNLDKENQTGIENQIDKENEIDKETQTDKEETNEEKNKNNISSDSDSNSEFEFCEEIEIDNKKQIIYIKDKEYTSEYVESYNDGLFSFNIFYKGFKYLFK